MSKTTQPEVQLLPTPHIGTPIQYWLDDMMSRTPVAAICVEVLGPGRCKLYVMEPGMVPYYKTGVNWAGDNRRLNPEGPYKLNGVWDFVPDMKPRDAAKLHKEQLAAVERARQEEEENAIRVKQAREAQHRKIQEAALQDKA